MKPKWAIVRSDSEFIEIADKGTVGIVRVNASAAPPREGEFSYGQDWTIANLKRLRDLLNSIDFED